MDVFRESGRSVPVYCDKHFSYDWKKAKWMYDQSKELKFPLMAGSSVPLAWRRPPLEIKMGATIDKAVMLSFSGNEIYGFHALEALECMVERRKGFETGISAVECREGDAVWKYNEQNPWANELMQEALKRCESVKEKAKKPSLFILEYRSGLKAAIYMLTGQIDQFAFAAKDPVVSTEIWLQPEAYFNHFSGLVYYIEQMLVTGRPAYPVERTLLTTGALAAIMDSCYEHRRIETPHLNITYKPTEKSLYNQGPVPKPVSPG
jgi:hypothetical protein